MARMESGYIDLCITSPPYDQLRYYNGFSFDFERVAAELFRVIKAGGVLVWVVSDSTINGSETGSSFKQALYFKRIGFNLHDTMIYHKDNPPPVGGSNRYYSSFEYMFILSKGKPETFNPILSKRRNKHNDQRTSRVKGFVRSKDGSFIKKRVALNEIVKKQNLWTYTVGKGNSSKDDLAFEHPAIFPESLAHDHLVSWSNEGDLIYDPFMGSGTTALVSIDANRRYVGSEISAEYYDLINKRIHLKTRQLKLW